MLQVTLFKNGKHKLLLRLLSEETIGLFALFAPFRCTWLPQVRLPVPKSVLVNFKGVLYDVSHLSELFSLPEINGFHHQ